jgi:hypothetical protein
VCALVRATASLRVECTSSVYEYKIKADAINYNSTWNMAYRGVLYRSRTHKSYGWQSGRANDEAPASLIMALALAWLRDGDRDHAEHGVYGSCPVTHHHAAHPLNGAFAPASHSSVARLAVTSRIRKWTSVTKHEGRASSAGEVGVVWLVGGGDGRLRAHVEVGARRQEALAIRRDDREEGEYTHIGV